MLTVSRIKGAGRAADYYGRDDYYVTGEADAPGLAWGGKGAERLNLQGAARGEDFRHVLGGANPDPQGPTISSATSGKSHHPGWDLTFSAPKSVSVAILVGGDKALDKAHDRAVQRAMDYAERHLSYTRVREGGERRLILTGNLLYAATVHGTSRDGDPQRHTHVVLANATCEQGSGAWRALESLHFYRHRMLLGKIYQAELALQAKAQGHHVRRGRSDGLYELDAWSRDQLKVFSKRTASIQQALEIERPGNARAREAVKLKNRPAKLDVRRGELIERWKAEASAAGLDVEQVIAQAQSRERGQDRSPQVVGRVSDVLSNLRALLGRDWSRRDPYGYLPGQPDRDPAARRAISYALQVSEMRNAVFTRHEVLERALEVAPSGVGVDRLEHELDRLHEDGRVRAADKTIPGGVTTASALAIEAGIIAQIDEGRGKGRPLLSRAEALRQLGEAGYADGGVVLNDGQRTAAAAILSSPDRFVAVQGYAGVGKTTLFAAAGRIAREQGVQLTAITPTHRAAVAMEQEAGIYAGTVSAWLVQMERAMKTQVGAKNMRAHWQDRALIIDEASMVSNAQMQAILDNAGKAEIQRVVLSGDDRQLGSPQAGAPFRLLLKRHIAQSRVTTIMRQRDPTLRESVRQLAHGRADAALRMIESRIHEVGRLADDGALAKAAVAAAEQERSRGADPRIVVPTNALRSKVAELLRDVRRQDGSLAQQGRSHQRYHHVRHDGPERYRASSYRLGDRLVFHRGVSSAGLPRGAEADVVGLDLRNDVLRVEAGGLARTLDLRALARQGKGPFDAYQVRDVEIAEGERMVWERAEPKRRYLTGAGFEVVAMKGRFWTIRHDDGRTEQLRADDPALKFAGYGYAETADRAQGQTYQSVVAVLASRHGEAASVARQYVMQSRPSQAFQMVTDERRLLVMKLGQQDGLNRIALENVEAALGRGEVGETAELAKGRADNALALEPGSAPSKAHGRSI